MTRDTRLAVAVRSPFGRIIAPVHPLDAFSLEGFVIVATSELVVRHDPAEVWTVLAVENEEPDDLPTGAVHRIVERFAPGEHRCSILQTVAGRTVCSRGFRRLLAGRELLEVSCGPTSDRLVRTTVGPARFGRTRIMTFAGVRTLDTAPPPAPITLRSRQDHDVSLLRARLGR